MQISNKGIAFIEAHEGFVARAYLDPAGVLTIGTGFTNRSDVFREYWIRKHGRPLKSGDVITREENRRILTAALANEYEPPVKAGMPLDAQQHEFDAAVSATFNLGARFMRWKAATLWKAGKRRAAAEHWESNYCRAGGRVLPGLVRRRKEEAHLFRTGVYPVSAEGSPHSASDHKPARPDPIVEEAQDALKRLGFDPGDIDGWMGKRTKQAVAAYQQRHPHLENDGILGPATLAQLRRDVLAAKDALAKGGGVTCLLSLGTLFSGFPWWAWVAAGVAVLAVLYFAWKYRDILARRINTQTGREVA
ncbi:glycoside hydrolase family protein [Roseibium sp.]|uniref:glycoside hydrolase family protein n=1 Tax=Roseibium sp. TaxID=1936156 RepID=UPI003BA939A6